MAIGKTNAQRKILLTTPDAVTPTKSQQTITTPDGYDGMDQVVVDAIPNKYIDTTISKNAATKAQILSGQKAYVNGSLVTGTMPTIDSLSASISSASTTTGTLKLNITPSVSGSIPGFSQDYGYISGYKTVSITDNNFIASNIRSGTSIFGIDGTLESGYKTVFLSCYPTSSGSYGYYNYTWTISNSNLTKEPKDFWLMTDIIQLGYVVGIRRINNNTAYYTNTWNTATTTGTPYITVSFEIGKLTINLMSCSAPMYTAYQWQGYAFI